MAAIILKTKIMRISPTGRSLLVCQMQTQSHFRPILIFYLSLKTKRMFFLEGRLSRMLTRPHLLSSILNIHMMQKTFTGLDTMGAL